MWRASRPTALNPARTRPEPANTRPAAKIQSEDT
jgi:hypothetical protein